MALLPGSRPARSALRVPQLHSASASSSSTAVNGASLYSSTRTPLPSSSAVSLPLSTVSSLTAGHANTTDDSTSAIRARIPSDSSTAVSHTYDMTEEDKIESSQTRPVKFPSNAAEKDPSFISVEALPASEASRQNSRNGSERQRARTHGHARASSSSSLSTMGMRMGNPRNASILLDTSSAPRRPYAPLTDQQKKLARMHRHSVGKRSIVPILYFLAASLGKLILGFGVSLAIKGSYADKKSDFGIGLGLAIGGFIAVVAAALGFGAAVSLISKKWGIIFKCFSIGGGIFISIGYALKQYFVSDDKPMFSIRLSFIPLALGTAMMGISLPNFTAYTELYRGRVVGFPIQHRHLIALLCLSPSMGILFGGWISAEVAHWPIAFNSSVLTFAVALGYAGVALFWSNHLRDRAELYDVLLLREEEEVERIRRREDERMGAEKVGYGSIAIAAAPGADLAREEEETRRDSVRVQSLESP